jgi:magnesium transporter
VTTPTLLIGTWYGMNLKMPEYQMEYAYPIAVAVDFVSTVGLIMWLRYKRWL